MPVDDKLASDIPQLFNCLFLLLCVPQCLPPIFQGSAAVAGRVASFLRDDVGGPRNVGGRRLRAWQETQIMLRRRYRL